MKLAFIYLLLVFGSVFLFAGCGDTAVDRGPVFEAVEKTLALPEESNPVKDDLMNRGLYTISANGSTGQLKVGEIEKLVEDGVYVIDEDGYLQFGPSYSSSATNPPQDQEPVAIISVRGIGPPNPGGPTVEMTLKNVGEELVIALYATLELERNYEFDFTGVTSAEPLLPGDSINLTRILIGPGSGISSDAFYPLEIRATLESGDTIVYTKQVKIQ